MLLLCLLLAAQGGGASQMVFDPSQLKVVPHDLVAYLRLAVQYRTPAGPAAVAELRDWTAGEIAEAQRALMSREGMLRMRATGPGELDVRLVESAALLQLEAGLRALQEPNEAQGDMLLEAGAALVRWLSEVAARRQKKPPTEPGVNPAAWQLAPHVDPGTMHAAIAGAALAVGFPEIAGRHAEAAQSFAPRDAGTLLIAGTAREGLAHLREIEGGERDARRLREDAQESYREVLAIDGSLHEARLRLGHLLAESSHFAEAEPMLLRVASETDASRQRYLALLFLARAAEQRKDVRGAGELYSRALTAVPDGTAARLGLALQLERQAGPAAARTLVLEALSRSRRIDGGTDPWTSYAFGQVDAASGELKRVWDRVLGP